MARPGAPNRARTRGAGWDSGNGKTGLGLPSPPFRRYRVGQWGGWPKSIRTNLPDSWAWSSPKGGLRPKPRSYAELTRSGERLCHPRAGLVPERGKGAEFDSASAFYVQ